ncbi:2-C-methyl-D-erythritol 2,4-cyclodiphosphate synthase [bacterium]|nr:2-C-methyl-D-erythritol 2,4-cyclodiphosphate synthase [bacterium]
MSEELGQLSGLRVGFGYDIHSFEEGAPLKLGGAEIDHTHGLVSHTDGDAVCHAVTDALLSACGMPDIGTVFPPGDERLKGEDSLRLLEGVADALYNGKLKCILNLGVTVLTEHPQIAPERTRIRGLLASVLRINPGQVSVSAGTNEKLDAIGRGEALAAFANVLLIVDEHNAERSGQREPNDEGDEALPARAKQFDQAVKTKIPPLPEAPRPSPGDELIVYTDGASRGNPGPAASGWVLFDSQGRLVHEQGTTLGKKTNNEAEYAAVGEALDWISEHLGTDFRLTIRVDSQLVARQLRGEYKIKAANLRQQAMLVMNVLMSFTMASIEEISRGENTRADALANRALDG